MKSSSRKITGTIIKKFLRRPRIAIGFVAFPFAIAIILTTLDKLGGR